jgi:hypothetical protein
MSAKMLSYNINVDYSLLVNVPPIDYNNLINKPTVGTQVETYLSSHPIDYNNLLNKPNIGS